MKLQLIQTTLEGTEYMDQTQLAFFRNLLLNQRRQLLESMREKQDCMLVEETSADEFDRAGREESWLVVTGIGERHNRELKRIHRALQRIEEGSYGYCEETDEPIGIQRLIVQPTANLSLEAQESREKALDHRIRRHQDQASGSHLGLG